MSASESHALVLEDTELGRWALTRALESEGFRVQAVSTWAEASVCLIGEKYRLVLIAVSSVLENVAEVITDVCGNHPDTHLILLADQDSVDGLRPVCHPETDILTKPFDPAEVAQMALARTGRSGLSPTP